MSETQQLTLGNVLSLLLECLDCNMHATPYCPAHGLKGKEAFTARARCIWGDDIVDGKWELGDFGRPEKEKP